jgi:hypothetical protein
MNEGTPKGLFVIYIAAICIVALVIASGSLAFKPKDARDGGMVAPEKTEAKHGQ